ncbi:MAG: UvrABC system protein C [Candidatus Peregrinibacteria bacterium Gr01-1014_25]|nr:MAG: UvrABC system protein C [Candidatus Peregrinibacteria bacterium Gr01-1014_25]
MADAPDHLRQLRTRVAKASTGPGVYRWLNEDGVVLYIGKAKNLRDRLRSYVAPAAWKTHGPWKQAMLRATRDVDITVTQTELEAYLLETNLIKEHRPKYNILMKDDKNYVYVQVTTQDPFPRIDVVRKVEDDQSEYIGPKTSAGDVRETLANLRRFFPFRTCRMTIEMGQRTAPLRQGFEGQASSPTSPRLRGASGQRIPIEVVCKNKDRATPCLDHHIGQCCAPCIGAVTPEEYRSCAIDPVLKFLRGDHAAVTAVLKEQMAQAVAARQFERAAAIRDQLQTIERLQEKQLISDASGEDADVIGVAVLSGRAHVVVFRRRDGRLVDDASFALQGQVTDVRDALTSFLPQYYADVPEIPPLIILGEEPGDRTLIETWLRERAGRAVHLRVPERGEKSKLLMLAEKNAHEKARHMEAKWESESRNVDDALGQLQSVLGLQKPPRRIEGYDISHLGGTETVGSMVVLLGGKAANDQYRSFTVQSVARGDVDDYRSLREVLTRRLRHLAGGVRRDTEQWGAAGVTFGKARKAEQGRLEEILASEAELSRKDIEYRSFLVARRNDAIIGCVRLRTHEGGLQEMSGLWIDPALRGKKLGHVLARLLLSKTKGKIYVRVVPQLEAYYADIGFRHILKDPPLFQKMLAEACSVDPNVLRRTVLVYDAAQHKTDASLSAMPDLLLIDGGKGQLGVAVDVLASLGLTISVASLAKREEEIFVPGSSEPVALPPDAPARFLLQRLRDEAHRFANRHRERRAKTAAVRSTLDTVPGIGPTTRRELLRRFGSVDGVRAAADDELLRIVNAGQLKALREHLQ